MINSTAAATFIEKRGDLYLRRSEYETQILQNDPENEFFVFWSDEIHDCESLIEFKLTFLSIDSKVISKQETSFKVLLRDTSSFNQHNSVTNSNSTSPLPNSIRRYNFKWQIFLKSFFTNAKPKRELKDTPEDEFLSS